MILQTLPDPKYLNMTTVSNQVLLFISENYISRTRYINNHKILFIFLYIYLLFIVENSDVLHDSWMLSRPTTNSMWYDRLSKLSKDEILPENLKLGENELSDSECLVLSKMSKLHPKLSVNVGDCNSKRSVVCRVEPQKINPLTRPEKFPCLQSSDFGRRKRSPNEHEHQKTWKGKCL